MRNILFKLYRLYKFSSIDSDWNVFADKAKIEMYLCFDWSNNCGEFFHRELVKSILTILKRSISPAKL